MILFREIQLGDAKKILDWRTSERVNKSSNSDMKYDIKGHTRWLSSNFNKRDSYHWIFQCRGKDAGYLNFLEWNAKNRTTEWSFYVGEAEALGVGYLVAPYFYNFAFDVLGVKKVLTRVWYNNTRIIDFHLNQGSRFEPERDFVIKKNGKDILFVCLSLARNDFKASKFSRFKQNLPISKWVANPF